MAAQDLSTQFDADWQKAQERYQAGVSGGYTEADADQLYLAPIRAKWKIIQASPETFQRKGNMAKINSDFEDAGVSAMKNLTRDKPTKPMPVKRPVRGAAPAVPEDSTGKTVADHFGPLVQKWAMEVTADKAGNKTSSAERKIELSDIRSSMRRATARRDKYHDKLVNNFPTITEPDARHLAIANHKSEEDKAISELAGLKAQEQTLLSGGTLPTVAAATPEVKMPVGEQGKFYNRVLADRAAIEKNPVATGSSARGFNMGLLGGNLTRSISSDSIAQESDQAKQVMSDFAKRLAPQIDPASGQVIEGLPAAAAAPAMPVRNNGQFFISGANGKPDLTNYAGGRAEADAAWAARSARGAGFTPPAAPDAAPVEPTATTVMADQTKPTPAGKNAPIDSQQAYDALASGDQYMDAQGNLRRKK
jgi:hypothetical protein